LTSHPPPPLSKLVRFFTHLAQAARRVFHRRRASPTASLNVLGAASNPQGSIVSQRAPSTVYSSTSTLVDALPSTTTLGEEEEEEEDQLFQVERPPRNYAEFIVQRAYFEQGYIQFLTNVFHDDPIPGLNLSAQDIRQIVQSLVPRLEDISEEGGEEREAEGSATSSTSSFHTVPEIEI